MKRLTLIVSVLVMFTAENLLSQTTTAYSPDALTTSDYARAEQFVYWNAEKLTAGTSVQPKWVDDNRFWYRNQVFGGHEFIMVDAGARTRRPVFDHDQLAAALSAAGEENYEAGHLPFDEFEFTSSGEIQFWTDTFERWQCDILSYSCSGPDSVARVTDEIKSNDGAHTAFSRGENLWVRNTSTDEERQLSQGGELHYGYGVVPEGCCSEITNRRSGYKPAPVLQWSPNGRRIATHRYDERDIKDLHLLEAAVGRPILHSYRYAMPGDSVIPQWELYVFDVETGEGVRADRAPMVARSIGRGNDNAGPVWTNVQWSSDGERVFFVDGTRDYKTQTLMEMDASTGVSRSVIVENGDTYVELNQLTSLTPNWQVLDNGREVVWFSERDGWGHLYLYNVENGQLKNQVTSGSWLVLDLLYVDDESRQVYFTAVGREPDRDPYTRHLYRASIDGGGVTLLTPEDMDHEVSVSPGGRFFVDTYSLRSEAPMTVLRDVEGRVLMTIEEADIDPLLEAGWEPPVRFVAKARDGVTDVYGYLWLPPDREEGMRYPIIDYVYPGPQIGPIRSPGFTTGPRGQGHAFAELGFVAFSVDAMGTPFRSKAFHDIYYEDMGDNGIPDHISALKELALTYPVDLDRVGIFGHSGGGFASTDAILRHPDFFKVAVSGAGNHDQRGYSSKWGEKYQGLLTHNGDGTDSFDSQANQNLAANLKGKLLLHYGTLDDNVHPNMTIVVANELMKHNKDFDMLVFPNRNHGYAREPYLIRRTWDYFVEHLMGSKPPREYKLVQPN